MTSFTTQRHHEKRHTSFLLTATTTLFFSPFALFPRKDDDGNSTVKAYPPACPIAFLALSNCSNIFVHPETWPLSKAMPSPFLIVMVVAVANGDDSSAAVVVVVVADAAG